MRAREIEVVCSSERPDGAFLQTKEQAKRQQHSLVQQEYSPPYQVQASQW